MVLIKLLREFSAAHVFAVNFFGIFGSPEMFWGMVYVNRTTHGYSEVRYYDLDSLRLRRRKHGLKPLKTMH